MTNALVQLKYMDRTCPLLEVWPKGFPEWQGQRNNSVLAHGYKPIGQKEYERAEHWFRQKLLPLWKELLERDLNPQLPSTASGSDG